MAADNVLDILKEAIFLERRGHAFYTKVAEQTDRPAVRAVFQAMADEEVAHIKILADQYAAWKKSGSFTAPGKTPQGAVAGQVLDDALKQQVKGAEFESAAVAAAMLMEQKAVDFYRSRAAAATDDQQAAVYDWLARWEAGHLELLAGLEAEIRQQVWNDAGFWPF